MISHRSDLLKRLKPQQEFRGTLTLEPYRGEDGRVWVVQKSSSFAATPDVIKKIKDILIEVGFDEMGRFHMIESQITNQDLYEMLINTMDRYGLQRDNEYTNTFSSNEIQIHYKTLCITIPNLSVGQRVKMTPDYIRELVMSGHKAEDYENLMGTVVSKNTPKGMIMVRWDGDMTVDHIDSRRIVKADFFKHKQQADESSWVGLRVRYIENRTPGPSEDVVKSENHTHIWTAPGPVNGNTKVIRKSDCVYRDGIIFCTTELQRDLMVGWKVVRDAATTRARDLGEIEAIADGFIDTPSHRIDILNWGIELASQLRQVRIFK